MTKILKIDRVSLFWRNVGIIAVSTIIASIVGDFIVNPLLGNPASQNGYGLFAGVFFILPVISLLWAILITVFYSIFKKRSTGLRLSLYSTLVVAIIAVFFIVFGYVNKLGIAEIKDPFFIIVYLSVIFAFISSYLVSGSSKKIKREPGTPK